MLLKEEFAANMSYLEPSINSMILAGEDLMTNKLLQEVLYMVLVAGNFLNSVNNLYQFIFKFHFKHIMYNVMILSLNF